MPRAAILFDWDGVVVDSARGHELAWERMAAQHGLPLPADHFHRGFGMRNVTIITQLLHWTDDPREADRLGDIKEAIFRDIVREQGLTALPGVRELLTGLHAAGIPRAVASSAPRANLDYALELLGLHDAFDAMIASEDVTRGKPDPQVFERAAMALGASPDRCVVIEDAPVGVRAGLAAGMRVLAVTTTHPADALAEAHAIAPSLLEVTPERLLGLLDASEAHARDR